MSPLLHTMELRRGGLDDPQVRALLQEHWEDMHAQSPPESVHALDVDRLRDASIHFWTVWAPDRLLGCGALKCLDRHHGELKSMRTARGARGVGVGRCLLNHLVGQAQALGMQRVSLETGPQAGFAAARALYARAGFAECGPFADYRPDPYSVFMTAALVDLPMMTVSAAVLRPDGAVLLVRKRGSRRLIHPGGKPLPLEAPWETLQRELLEELGTPLRPEGWRWLGPFEAAAVHEAGRRVCSLVAVGTLESEPYPSGEIEALAWVPVRPAPEEGSSYPEAVAPLSAEHILPALARAQASGSWASGAPPTQG